MPVEDRDFDAAPTMAMETVADGTSSGLGRPMLMMVRELCTPLPSGSGALAYEAAKVSARLVGKCFSRTTKQPESWGVDGYEATLAVAAQMHALQQGDDDDSTEQQENARKLIRETLIGMCLRSESDAGAHSEEECVKVGAPLVEKTVRLCDRLTDALLLAAPTRSAPTSESAIAARAQSEQAALDLAQHMNEQYVLPSFLGARMDDDRSTSVSPQVHAHHASRLDSLHNYADDVHAGHIGRSIFKKSVSKLSSKARSLAQATERAFTSGSKKARSVSSLWDRNYEEEGSVCVPGSMLDEDSKKLLLARGYPLFEGSALPSGYDVNQHASLAITLADFHNPSKPLLSMDTSDKTLSESVNSSLRSALDVGTELYVTPANKTVQRNFSEKKSSFFEKPAALLYMSSRDPETGTRTPLGLLYEWRFNKSGLLGNDIQLPKETSLLLNLTVARDRAQEVFGATMHPPTQSRTDIKVPNRHKDRAPLARVSFIRENTKVSGATSTGVVTDKSKLTRQRLVRVRVFFPFKS